MNKRLQQVLHLNNQDSIKTNVRLHFLRLEGLKPYYRIFLREKYHVPCCSLAKEEMMAEILCHRFFQGLVQELNPGPLASQARIIPLDQRATTIK